MLICPLLIASVAALALAVVVGNHLLRRRVVRRAIATELVGLRWQAAAMAAEITRRIRADEAFDNEFFHRWRLSEPQVFPALGADFGLLAREGIARVGYFHAQLATARERWRLAADEGGFRPSAYRILSALVRACNDIEPWAKPHLDIVTGTTPDMTDANKLLGEFEAAGAEPLAVAYLWADGCVRMEDLNADEEPAGSP